jgi:hypothetical protein
MICENPGNKLHSSAMRARGAADVERFLIDPKTLGTTLSTLSISAERYSSFLLSKQVVCRLT